MKQRSLFKHSLMGGAAILAGAATLTSCHTGVCSNNQNSIPVAAFFSAADDKAISLTGLRISGVDAPNDSILYPATGSLSTIYLPLRIDSDVTSFRFHFNYQDYTDEETGETVTVHTADDILTLHYSATPFFDGEDCGAMYHYYIDRAHCTTHYIERVEVTDPFITNVDAVRIKIYFRTQEEDEDNTDTETGTETGEDSGEDSGAGLPEEGGEQ